MKEREEKLLNLFLDKECNFIQEILAKKLLRSSKEARGYLEELIKGKEEVIKIKDTTSPNLINNINHRIEEEERLAELLGERRTGSVWYFLTENLRPLAYAVPIILVFSLLLFSRDSITHFASNAGNNRDLEVEWMKSQRRVEFIPADNSEIIWIKKGQQSAIPNVITVNN